MTLWFSQDSLTIVVMFGSEEEVQLCERGGETTGEEREAATAAARAKGEESAGQCIPMDFQHNCNIASIIFPCLDVAAGILYTHIKALT